ncbi:MAG TPA: hypothetical protein VIU13_10020, partial [Chryseolinea sp.]
MVFRFQRAPEQNFLDPCYKSGAQLAQFFGTVRIVIPGNRHQEKVAHLKKISGGNKPFSSLSCS